MFIMVHVAHTAYASTLSVGSVLGGSVWSVLVEEVQNYMRDPEKTANLNWMAIIPSHMSTQVSNPRKQ